MTQPLKGILFDLDGTLVDSLKFTFDGFNHAIVGQGGKELSPLEIMKHFGPGEGEIFAKILGSEKAEAAYVSYRKYADENLGRVPLHRGVEELLEQIKSARVPIGIVTGRSWDTTQLILKHHGLMDRFLTIICHDHVSSSKPSPEGIQTACARIDLDPSQVMYVGDMHVDTLAAKRAGATAVAALWDMMAKREVIEPHQPHHWAEVPAHVWDIWQKA